MAKRSLNSPKWEIAEMQYNGNIHDALNTISKMTDSDGFFQGSFGSCLDNVDHLIC